MIALRDVTVQLPPNAPNPKTVLDRVSLRIGRGEWIALVGPNGSGKSTLLHAIAGLVPACGGEIVCARRPRSALLLQEPDNLFVTTSVRHELELSLPDAAPPGSGRDRWGEVVERFGLARLMERNPHRLSGGEKQRLALATVWLRAPELLLLDEPTAYLDGEAASLCVEFVRDARRGGSAVVWATPGGAELDAVDRVVCLREGRVAYDGGSKALYRWAEEAGFDLVRPPLRQAAVELAGAVSDARTSRRVLDAARDGTAALAETIASLVADPAPDGTEFSETETVAAAGVAAAVSLVDVGFAYGRRPVLENVALSVGVGECVGLAGPNGAGKSTVLGLAAGMLAPTSGTVERCVQRVRTPGRRDVFLLFQNPERMFFAESVAEELAFGLERLGLQRGERSRRARAALEDVGLPPDSFLDRAPLTLSPGEMRRVAFAIALSLEPELLLLDEPASCLDTRATAVLTSLLASRRARGGTTVVASHDASFLSGVCDRIIWLRAGRVEAEVATAGGRLPPGAVWPGEPLCVLELQDRLAGHGVEVTPRRLTAARLAERLW